LEGLPIEEQFHDDSLPLAPGSPDELVRRREDQALHPNSEWRCTRCDKLLGVCRDGRMHLRFARGHEYLVGFPVQATCRGCGSLNNATAPAR
jgi:hypothetical protein